MRKNILFATFAAALFLLIVLFPAASLAGARDAIDAWLESVLPALLPFFVAASLLSACGATARLAQLLSPAIRAVFGFSGHFAYVFLTAALAGYPMGARLCCDLYSKGALSAEEAARMVNATSVSGPMFVCASVAIGMVGVPAVAPYILIPHYLSGLLVALLNGRHRRIQPSPAATPVAPAAGPLSFGAAIAECVSSAMQTMLLVLGFMMVYSVLLSCLGATGLLGLHPLAKPLAGGILEMATGCLSTEGLPFATRIVFLSGIISFGGLSIHSQTYAIASGASLQLAHFSGWKVLHGALSAGITFLALRLLPPAESAFSGAAAPAPLPNFPLLFLAGSAAIFFLLRLKRTH